MCTLTVSSLHRGTFTAASPLVRGCATTHSLLRLVFLLARHPCHPCSTGRRIYVFGGFDGTSWRNDVVALDVDSCEWHLLRPRGPSPGPRASTSAALVGGDKAAFFGGYDGADFKDVSDAGVCGG